MENNSQQLTHLGMDPKHRTNIKTHMDTLVNETNYTLLLRACREKGLLSPAMINKIEANLSISDNLDDGALQRERHRRLFNKLTKRGPDAYQKLKNILSQLGYDAALKCLNMDNSDESHQSISTSIGRPVRTVPPQRAMSATITDGSCSSKINGDDLLELRPYTDEICPTQIYEVKKSTVIHKDDKVGVYPMKTQNNRGILLLVNIIKFTDKESYRNGATEDGESLRYLFKELGFKLYAYDNLTHQEFFHLLGALLQSEDVRQAECFVLALMSHGDMDSSNFDRVQFSDGSIVKVNDILDKFNNKSCLNLINKPKIFLFPFCRGVDYDLGHKQTQFDGVGNTALPHTNRKPLVSDTLVCHATYPGYRAHRDMQEGSWYIQCFCKLMAENAHDTHFEDILKMIQDAAGERRSESGSMQVGNYNNISFNKKLFFNPGAYE